MTWVEKHFFEHEADVEKFLSTPYIPPTLKLDSWQSWQEKIGDEGLVLAGISDAVMLPGSWFTPEQFMMTYMLNPDLIMQLIETAQERILIFVQNCLDAEINHFRLIGPELAAPPPMSPTTFAQLVASFDTEVISLIRAAGDVAHVHMHGAIHNMLEQVADLGSNSLDPLEAPPGGNVDLADAKRRIGDRVCLLGNLDDLEVIMRASSEELRTHCKACLEAAASGGGYILGGTSS